MTENAGKNYDFQRKYYGDTTTTTSRLKSLNIIIIIMKNPILGVSGVLDVLVLLETARFTSHCLLVLYIIYAW